MSENDYSWTENMLLLDRTNDTDNTDIGYPFALEELLCKQAGEGGPPVCHLWRHPRAFVMGSRDSRLPKAADAVRQLEEAGYAVLVRHSGGAAVPLDAGVINLSLIMPMSEKYAFGFRNDFERMYALISGAAASAYGYTVSKGEVQGSYCPGEYDLHIDGLKFCGIAQRRQVRAMIIQAFVIVEGSAPARAERVRAFYERAGNGARPGSFPIIVPESMRSLLENSVIGNGGVDAFTNAVIRTLSDFQTASGNAALTNARIHMPEPRSIMEMSERLRQRYPVPR
ncbi:lipoate--protein ligase family protein [Cohnella silvisoli]|uniref:Lipoate--protein ligase family protein n=1 Tax=Cohnella silvisoli TaxID=2873699 RepID=A0ABV1KQ75_9BACL|nr:lipoate--protein ligase family protein [Cohnella silvisoli]MCD9022114.1 lipoate--protein ligase family protein [Cohnella silvisoli]